MPNIPSPRNIPFSLQDIRDEFDRLLDRVWHVGLNTAPLDGQDWAPSIDVVDEADRYRIRAEIPGLSADDVEVSILDGRLTIKGTKPAGEEPGEQCRYLRRECRYGSFCRHYELPAPVAEEGVSASCKSGVLEVTIPKQPEARGRPVKIESEE